MISPEDLDEIIYARWQIQHGGQWCPVTKMFTGQTPTSSPLYATAAVIWTGSADGEWSAIRVSPGEILAREPGCAPEWIHWSIVARIRQAAHGSPQARQPAVN